MTTNDFVLSHHESKSSTKCKLGSLNTSELLNKDTVWSIEMEILVSGVTRVRLCPWR